MSKPVMTEAEKARQAAKRKVADLKERHRALRERTLEREGAPETRAEREEKIRAGHAGRVERGVA